MAWKNLRMRIPLLLLAIFPLFFLPEFSEHFLGHFTGSVEAIAQQWHIAVLNIAFFVAFLVPLTFRRKAGWKEHGLVSAFFISLFIEMYGVAFSMIFASSYLFPGSTARPASLFSFSFLGVEFAMTIGMVYGLAVMVVGTLLIALGWVTLYRNKGKGLVKNGIYGYSRHPQYLGFILVVLGWFVSWPTILTAAFVPVLLYMYVRVSRKEGKEVSKEFPEYREYREKTPFLV